MANTISLNQLGARLNRALVSTDVEVRQKAETAVRIATIQTWGKIIRMTPVDTGRARGNWFIGMSVGSEINNNPTTPNSQYVPSNLPDELLGNKVYLYNNLPYIEKLEFGSSNQAPSGMVRVSLLGWGRRLRTAFRAVQ